MIQKSSIVFIQTAFIGDLFLSLPTLDRIRILFPNHQIILICKKGLSEIFLKENKIDFAFEIEKGKSESYRSVLHDLTNFQIDYLICPHQSLRSSLFAYRIKAKNKVGFDQLFNKLIFNHTVPYQKKWPDAIRQLNLLSALDANFKSEIQKQDWSYLNVKKTDENRFVEIPNIFSYNNTFGHVIQKNGVVAVFPGSVWKTKQWTVDGFSDVVSDLIKKNKAVFLMGGPVEKDICNQIQLKNPSAINFAGKLSLYESFMQLKKCELVICNDSAPQHMATSLGLRVISIFGPTTPGLGFRPWADDSVVLENLNINCRPCGAHGHQQCPLGHHKCMVDLKSELVIKNYE